MADALVFNVGFYNRLFMYEFCVRPFFFYRCDVDGKFILREGIDDQVQTGIVLDPMVIVIGCVLLNCIFTS